MSVVARSLKGTLVGSIAFAVQVVLAIVVVPFMLEGWSATQYALWLACQAGYSILLTFDVGHQGYVGNELNKLLPVDAERTRVVARILLLRRVDAGQRPCLVPRARWERSYSRIDRPHRTSHATTES